MAILNVRVDIPGVDVSTTTPDQAIDAILNYFNGWARAYQVPEVGNETREAEWVVE